LFQPNLIVADRPVRRAAVMERRAGHPEIPRN
jgi:hypothetical protein